MANEAARSCTVAIIGGGPAGVCTARCLLAAGHHPVIFEAGHDLGGIWAADPTNRVTYRGLTTNIPTACMQSFDLDFPEGLPSYIESADLGNYVLAYAEHFGLRPHIRCGTRVTSATPLCSEAEEAASCSSWRVTWSTSCANQRREEAANFDAVVVATGHYEAPYRPEIPGQAHWLSSAPDVRSVAHARDYDDPAMYSGRVVLVVGGRSSAVDVARELRGVAGWVYVLSKNFEEVHTVGSCTHVPLGTELCADGRLNLPSGQPAQGPPVEDVIFATGYIYDYPFLDAESLGLDFGPHRRYVAPLHQHIVHARRPSLSFVGVPLSVPCPMPLFEAQAHFLSARLRRPVEDTAARLAWVEARFALVGDRLQDLNFTDKGTYSCMRELMALAGTTGEEYEKYVKRLAVVEEIHKDRCSRSPKLPWDDDTYRKCEYEVDWQTGSWSVRP